MASIVTNKFIIESCANRLEPNSTIAKSLSRTERSFLKKREIYETCFSALDAWITSRLRKKKGADIPNFATISWERYEALGGGQRTRPIFLPHPEWTRAHKILYMAPVVPPKLARCEEVSYSRLALKHSRALTKDVVFTGVRDLLRKIGEVCGAGREVEVRFAFGALRASERRARFEFAAAALVDPEERPLAAAPPAAAPAARPEEDSRQTTGRSAGGSSSSGQPAPQRRRPPTASSEWATPASVRSRARTAAAAAAAASPPRLGISWSAGQLLGAAAAAAGDAKQENARPGSSPALERATERTNPLFHGGRRPLRKLGSQQDHDAMVPSVTLYQHSDSGLDHSRPTLPEEEAEAEEELAAAAAAAGALQRRGPARGGTGGFLADAALLSEHALVQAAAARNSGAHGGGQHSAVMDAAIQRYVAQQKAVAREEDRLLRNMDLNREVDEKMMKTKFAKMRQRRLDLQKDIEQQIDEMRRKRAEEARARREAAPSADFPLPLKTQRHKRLSHGGDVYAQPFDPPLEMSTGNGGLDFGGRRGRAQQVETGALHRELREQIQGRLRSRARARARRLEEEKQYVDRVLAEHEKSISADALRRAQMKEEMVSGLNKDIHMRNLQKLTKLGQGPLEDYLATYAGPGTAPPEIYEAGMFANSRRLRQGGGGRKGGGGGTGGGQRGLLRRGDSDEEEVGWPLAAMGSGGNVYNGSEAGGGSGGGEEEAVAAAVAPATGAPQDGSIGFDSRGV